MTTNYFLFSINVFGAFLSVAFIIYEMNVDRKRFAEQRHYLNRAQRR